MFKIIIFSDILKKIQLIKEIVKRSINKEYNI